VETFVLLIPIAVLVIVGVFANDHGRDSRVWLNTTFPGFVERPG
jgi:hypothetical protein